MRDLRKIARGVEIALERRRRLDVMLDSVESCREGRGEGEIRIRIRSWSAAFNAQGLSMSDDAKACGTIGVAPLDSRRRERSRHVAFVRRRIRRIKR